MGKDRDRKHRRRRRRSLETDSSSSSSSSPSCSDSESHEEKKRRRSHKPSRRRREKSRHRTREEDAIRSSRKRKRRRRQRSPSSLSGDDSSSSAAGDLSEPKYMEPEAVLCLILEKFPDVAHDLEQLLQVIDSGEGVDIKRVSTPSTCIQAKRAKRAQDAYYYILETYQKDQYANKLKIDLSLFLRHMLTSGAEYFR